MNVFVPSLPFALAFQRRRNQRGGQRTLTIETPMSPIAPGSSVTVSGTYTGTATTIAVVWFQDGATVGAPVIASHASGTWQALLAAPAAEGIYRLRATLDGEISVDSGPIAVGAATPATVANLQFTGTGLPADVIDVFGHAFPQGAIPNNTPVVLRAAADGELLRTQMTVLRRWPDESVMTAVFAAELPALAAGQVLAAELVSGSAHPDPGPNLSLPALLAGRSAVVRTWAPGDTTTPLWTFDVASQALASTDRWQEGPLAVETRVETPVPPTAVLNTADQAGQIASVRLIVDLLATKDGFLELDVCFSNDRVLHPQGGIARFGYTIEIDGQIVYDQRPASGPARDLLQYAQWIRRRARHPNGTVLTGWDNNDRPFFRPDFDVLVASGVQHNMDRSMPLTEYGGWAPWVLNTAKNNSRINDPYWNYSLARDAGTAGGRPEIGYRTVACMLWLREGRPEAQQLAHREFEAASTRGIYFYDWELGRWVNPVDWPRFSTTGNAPASAPGTSRRTATGLPSNQRPTHNRTDHITVDHAHHGSFNFTPALLSGRRLCYDGLAARACWAQLHIDDRHDGLLPGQYNGNWTRNWRDLTPDHSTGRAWAQKPWFDQTRGWAWCFRDIVDAAAILPDSYTNRLMYTQSVEAWVSSIRDISDEAYANLGAELGMPMLHATGDHMPPFMYSFIFFGLLKAARLGLGGPHLPWLIREFGKLRSGSILDPGFSFQHAAMGRDIYFRATNGSWARNWSQVLTITRDRLRAINSDITANDYSAWTGEGDWQRNVLVGLTLLAEYAPDPETRAQAADALVFLRSQRAQGVGNHPRYRPEDFFGAFFQLNSVIAPRFIWRTDQAPVISAGQTMSVPLDAEEGALVGLVHTTGPIPRNSAVSGRMAEDAFVIVSQPAGNPFRITQGGAIRVANTTALRALPLGPVSLQVYCRTFHQWRVTDPATEYRSNTATITVQITAELPFIAEVTQPFAVGNNSPVGAEIGQLTVSGTRPITLSIIAGDPNGLFAVDDTGRVTIAADLSNEAAGLRTLTFCATNAAGSFDRPVPIELQGIVTPPVFSPDNQALSISEDDPPNTALLLTLTGSPASTLTITSGNEAGRWQAAVPNILRNTQRLSRLDAATYTLELRASNVAGSGTGTATITVTPAEYVYGAFGNVDVLFAGSVARRLRLSYQGPLARVFRSPDGTGEHLDIFADASGVADFSGLAAFAQGQQCFVALFDQSTLERGLAQPVPQGYPRLTDEAGNLRTVNGRAFMNFQGARRGMRYGNFRTHRGRDLAFFCMAVRRGGSWARLVALSRAIDDNPAWGDTSFEISTVAGDPRRLILGTRGNELWGPPNILPADTPRVIWGTSLSGVANEARRVGAGSISGNSGTATFNPVATTAWLALGGRARSDAGSWDGDVAEFFFLGGAVVPTTWETVIANMNSFYGVA